jgi:hypothetical protein
MWTYNFEVAGYTFRLISEWAGGVTLGINRDYEATPEFISAFTEAMGMKGKIATALEFDYECQSGNLNFARQFHGETDEEWYGFLVSIQDNEYLSDELRELVVDELNNILKRQERKQHSRIVRKEFQRDYDKLFMLIGRRDGFECVVCGVTRNLSIDHKLAVFNGGTNEPDNLQLMCRSHNSQKGAR